MTVHEVIGLVFTGVGAVGLLTAFGVCAFWAVHDILR